MKPQVVILCGGRGTRLREKTSELPKALVEVGGRPLLWHVVSIFHRQGFRDFLFLTGYLGEMVADYVGSSELPEGGSYECLNTGSETPTGGRVAAASDRLRAGTFMLTYVDGLADVDLDALLTFHRDRGVGMTMTAVRPFSQWGVAEVDASGLVSGFTEKPRSRDWVNGGFLCLDPSALDSIGPDDVLEEGPMQGLAAIGELAAYRHEGFWDCIDTYKDLVEVNDMWARGETPWLGS